MLGYMACRTSVISILFLKPLRREEVLANRVAAWFGWLVHGNNFHHAELCIPYRGGQMSSSVYQGETVSLTQVKSFANPGYIVHSMTVTNDELVKLTQFMVESHQQKVRFDACGMYLALLPFHICRSSKGKTFCSKYVTDALQHAGILDVQGVNSSIVTPARLYQLLQVDPEKRMVVGSVAYKQDCLTTHAVI